MASHNHPLVRAEAEIVARLAPLGASLHRAESMIRALHATAPRLAAVPIEISPRGPLSDTLSPGETALHQETGERDRQERWEGRRPSRLEIGNATVGAAMTSDAIREPVSLPRARDRLETALGRLSEIARPPRRTTVPLTRPDRGDELSEPPTFADPHHRAPANVEERPESFAPFSRPGPGAIEDDLGDRSEAARRAGTRGEAPRRGQGGELVGLAEFARQTQSGALSASEYQRRSLRLQEDLLNATRELKQALRDSSRSYAIAAP